MPIIDMSLATTKAPPRKRAASTRTPAAPQPDVSERREQAFMGLGQIAQSVCIMSGQYADAATIGRYWEGIGKEVVPIANMPGNEWLGSGLDLLVKVGPYTSLMAVLIPFGLQLAANHKMVDASKVGGQGVVPPEVLEAQMRAQTAQMQVEALKAKNDALRYAAQMQAEHEKAMAEYNNLNGSGE